MVSSLFRTHSWYSLRAEVMACTQRAVSAAISGGLAERGDQGNTRRRGRPVGERDPVLSRPSR